MKRRMGFLEASMYAGADTPVNVVFTVRIDGQIREEDLRIALKKIQNKHPLLNVTVEEDVKGIPWYVAPSQPTPIPLRIVTRLSYDHWKNEAETEWKTMFDMASGPLARLVWIRAQHCSELMLVCHHCICDATSVITIMREILEITDRPDIELSPYTSLSIQELIPDQVRRNVLNKITARLIAGITWIYLRSVSHMKEVRKENFYTIRWKLSTDETAVILAQCKKEGISVNSALCLVFMKAFESMPHLKLKGKIFCPVDIRRFLPEVKKDHLFAFPSVAGLSFLRNQKLSFPQQANELKERLYNEIAATDARKMLMFTEYLVPLYPRSIRYAKAGKGPHDFNFSNLGRIDIGQDFDTFRVAEVHSPYSQFPMGNPTKIIISTFRQQIDFAFASEEGFLKYQDALAVCEKAMQLLADNLTGVELTPTLDLK